MSDEPTAELSTPEPPDPSTDSSQDTSTAAGTGETSRSEIRMGRVPAVLAAAGLVVVGLLGGALITHSAADKDREHGPRYERAGFKSGPHGGREGRGGPGMRGGEGRGGPGMRGGEGRGGPGTKPGGYGHRGTGGPGMSGKMMGQHGDMHKLMCTVVQDELKLSNSDISKAVKNAAATLQKDGTLTKEQATRITEHASSKEAGFLSSCK